MIDSHSPTGHRCGDCGRFASCTYEWRGPAYVEVTYCEHCETEKGDN